MPLSQITNQQNCNWLNLSSWSSLDNNLWKKGLDICWRTSSLIEELRSFNHQFVCPGREFFININEKKSLPFLRLKSAKLLASNFIWWEIIVHMLCCGPSTLCCFVQWFGHNHTKNLNQMNIFLHIRYLLFVSIKTTILRLQLILSCS